MAVRVYKVVDDLKPVKLADLTAAQIEAIEEDADVPFNLWGQRGSLMRVLRLVLATGNGADPDALLTRTLREFSRLVQLDEAPDEAPAPEPAAADEAP